jgi:hypothetical protein
MNEYINSYYELVVRQTQNTIAGLDSIGVIQHLGRKVDFEYVPDSLDSNVIFELDEIVFEISAIRSGGGMFDIPGDLSIIMAKNSKTWMLTTKARAAATATDIFSFFMPTAQSKGLRFTDELEFKQALGSLLNAELRARHEKKERERKVEEAQAKQKEEALAARTKEEKPLSAKKAAVKTRREKMAEAKERSKGTK